MSGQPELILNDRSSMRQTLFVTVLGNDNHSVDGIARQLRIGGEQRIGRLNAKIRGFLLGCFAR
ncbi:hypothetical protein D3C77_292160 [compost metagenome]